MPDRTILQVITDTDRRGAQVFATDLHEALERRGRPVRTVALAPGRHGDLLDVSVLGRARLGPGTLAALRREIAAARVVVGHGSSSLPACALAGAVTRTPFAYRQISDSLFWADTPARRLRVRTFLRRARCVVALWSGAATVLAERFGVDERRLHVIPNGVPAARYPPVDPAGKPATRRRFGLSPQRLTVLCIGALVPEKGVDAAIRAVGRCADLQLLVVGAGPEDERLRALASACAPERVGFAGPVDDPAEAFAAADVVVLPSRGGDSMPGVLIEAGLSGLPAVSTPIGGIPAILLAGRTGELVAPDDEPGLAAAIVRALERADRYGAAARRHCLECFEIGVVADAWDRLLADVTG